MENNTEYAQELNIAISNRSNDPGFVGMFSYYQEMRRNGYATKNKYPATPLSIITSKTNAAVNPVKKGQNSGMNLTPRLNDAQAEYGADGSRNG